MGTMRLIDENAVVEAVCRHLAADGWTIRQRLTTKQQGEDVIAERAGELLLIEAKGGTSSFGGSPRYGRGFSESQQIDRVMKGFFTACALAEGGSRSALAMPRSPTAERYIGKVRRTMARLGVGMMWVEPDGGVTVELG